MAGGYPRAHLVGQEVHLGLRLRDAGELAGVLQHGDPCRVVAAVLETLQRIQEDRSSLPIAKVADDSTHRQEQRQRTQDGSGPYLGVSPPRPGISGYGVGLAEVLGAARAHCCCMLGVLVTWFEAVL